MLGLDKCESSPFDFDEINRAAADFDRVPALKMQVLKFYNFII